MPAIHATIQERSDQGGGRGPGGFGPGGFGPGRRGMRRPGTGASGTRERAFNVPPVTLAIAAILVVVWLAIQILPDDVLAPILWRLILFPARFVATWDTGDPGAIATEALTLLTYGLVHFEGIHIVANVGFLLAFGSQCERQMGWQRYVALTLVSTIAGGVAELLAVGDGGGGVLGASAATSGMMGAFAWTLLTAIDPQRRRFGVGLVLAFVAINLIFALLGGAVAAAVAPVAWQAHIGGFAAGMAFGVTDPVRRMMNRGGPRR